MGRTKIFRLSTDQNLPGDNPLPGEGVDVSSAERLGWGLLDTKSDNL